MKAEELRNNIFNILKKHLIIPTFEMVTDLSVFAASQQPTVLKNIEDIKLKWQKHNRDNGLSWNEVAELVNQVAVKPTLSHDKVMEVLINYDVKPSYAQTAVYGQSVAKFRKTITTAICSLSIPVVEPISEEKQQSIEDFRIHSETTQLYRDLREQWLDRPNEQPTSEVTKKEHCCINCGEDRLYNQYGIPAYRCKCGYVFDLPPTPEEKGGEG